MSRLLIFSVFFVSLAYGMATIYRKGNVDDVSPTLIGPCNFLQGNGEPIGPPYYDYMNLLSTEPIDVVVLAASYSPPTEPFPECDTILGGTANSCTTITMRQEDDSNSTEAANAVSQAEAVYFAGGDQCNYVGWKNSKVMDEVRKVFARGGGVGGGSAGLAIQGDYVYDSCNGSVTSAEALKNPYIFEITFTYNLFDWPCLEEFITDTHFEQRDRMGRLMTFLARQIQDGVADIVYGVGVNENVSVVVDTSCKGTAYGGDFYVVMASHEPEECVKRTPLTYSDFKIWKVQEGETFDFSSRTSSSESYIRSVVDGVIDSDPYTPDSEKRSVATNNHKRAF